MTNYPAGYTLPKFDIEAMTAKTKAAPTWLHMGAGNIFRAFLAVAQQRLLDDGLTDTGIIVSECYDEEIIPTTFAPYDNRTLAVMLGADGSLSKRVVASIAEAINEDNARLFEVISSASLQLISFTITEKGYMLPETINSPSEAVSTIEIVTAGLLERFKKGEPPIALVAMDNFAENGTKLAQAVFGIAKDWLAKGLVTIEFVGYIGTIAFPWTMIDKITPRPMEEVAKMLEADGYPHTAVTQTKKNTYVASFVNAETSEYLVIEDTFPMGRPPLEKAGVYFTERETVHKVDQMKVCACLNPLHTILAISGMLLGIKTIPECMKDGALVNFIKQSATESMPAVEHPGIMNPEDFLNEVLTQRFPNPYLPDATARIAMDSSMKIPVRFGETMKNRARLGLPVGELKAIPLFVALWLRYRTGLDDSGNRMEISPDPRTPEKVAALQGLAFGGKADLRGILADSSLFGVDLNEAGLTALIEEHFAAVNSGAGAVRARVEEVFGV